MRNFPRMLAGEFLKLFGKRRVWLAFVLCLAVELLCFALFQFPAARLLAEQDFGRLRLDFAQSFSGLTVASHLLGQTMMFVGAFAVALILGESFAQEAEAGTLRMVLCRPVSRLSLFGQKLLAGLAFIVLLTLFIGASALLIGLIFEGCGSLVMIVRTEEVLGRLDFAEGLRRYVIATALLTASTVTIGLLAFTLSCLPVKPVTASALAITWLIVESALRQTISGPALRPYLLLTHLAAWLQTFNTEIPWPRITHSYTVLAWINAGLLAAAFAILRRREFKP